MTVVAAGGCLLTALALHTHITPEWPSAGWLALLALSSQVLGWMLITTSLPRLPAALTSITLTIQPVGSVILGVILLGEEPSELQLLGVLCVLCGLIVVAVGARRRVPEVV
jgi:drug/metabolite transporter (DMT)-like permease